jgi:hypothetical protein
MKEGKRFFRILLTFNYSHSIRNNNQHNKMGNNLPECGRRRSSEKMTLGGDESPIDTEEYYNAEMTTQQF